MCDGVDGFLLMLRSQVVNRSPTKCFERLLWRVWLKLREKAVVGPVNCWVISARSRHSLLPFSLLTTSTMETIVGCAGYSHRPFFFLNTWIWKGPETELLEEASFAASEFANPWPADASCPDCEVELNPSTFFLI